MKSDEEVVGLLQEIYRHIDREELLHIVELSRSEGVKSLEQMAEEVCANNIDKGWFEKDRTFGDEMALLHSEVSEMFEEFRNRGDVGNSFRFEFGPESPVKHVGPVHLPGDEDLAQQWRDAGMVPKPIGAASEAADVLIRLLDTCHRYGIDLGAEYEQKMAYNRTRPHRHGGKAL